MCHASQRLAALIRVDAIWLATEPLDMRAGTETALLVSLQSLVRRSRTALICLQTVAPLALKSWYMTGLAFGWRLAG